MLKIHSAFMRGGTSKACFFRKEDLPEDERIRDEIILKIMGSPDKKQINGMGGATINTSKVAIISISERDDADIDYYFNQVSIDSPVIEKGMNCGNISSAVGPYAINEGLVQAVEPITTVRIYNVNTDKLIYAHVPVKDSRAVEKGTYEIAGVPGTGARIDLEFLYPQGAATGKTLPTGKAKESIEIDGTVYDYSFVDAGNAIVFVRPEQFGVEPEITPEEFEHLENINEIKRRLEIIRGTCAVDAGMAEDLEDAKNNSPSSPKMAFCHPCIADKTVIIGRFISAQEKMAPAFAVTGGICIGVAAGIEGTLVNDILGGSKNASRTISIAHPSGIMDVTVFCESDNTVKSCQIGRTSRLIMDGYVYVNI